MICSASVRLHPPFATRGPVSVVRLPLVTAQPRWRTAQLLGVVLTAVLLGAFVLVPETSLHLFWDRVIPLLPAVFLLNPLIWRNVCPLATLNEMGSRRRAGRLLSPPVLAVLWTVGIGLLVLMVPARRFLFNVNGLSMTMTVSAVAALALASGLVASRRAGFCNSLCPVLPVEKLYGQAPLLEVGSARCGDCNRCVTLACPDLAGRKSAVQSLTGGRGRQWILSPFGLFACAFPGFIIGYFRTADGPMSHALATYATVGQWGLGSVVAAALLLGWLRRVRALLMLGSVSIGTYYWFAAPRLADAYGGTAMAGQVLRALVLVGIVAWTWRAWRRLPA